MGKMRTFENPLQSKSTISIALVSSEMIRKISILTKTLEGDPNIENPLEDCECPRPFSEEFQNEWHVRRPSENLPFSRIFEASRMAACGGTIFLLYAQHYCDTSVPTRKVRSFPRQKPVLPFENPVYTRGIDPAITRIEQFYFEFCKPSMPDIYVRPVRNVYPCPGCR